MNILQRIALATQLVVGGQKSFRATALSQWKEGKPSYLPVDFPTMVHQGWRKNELIFSCIDRTARTASQINTKIIDIRSEKELPEHPMRKLLSNPNSEMSEYDFWQSVIIYLNLAGVAYYEKERSAAGQVVGLYPLRPDWCSPVASSEELVSHYIYKVPGMHEIVLPKEDVLVFKNFDPINMYQGLAPVSVAARIGDIDNSTTDFVKLFWERGGVPLGLLTSTQSLADAQVTTIRKRWTARYGGFKNWTAPAVLDRDARYERTGLTFDEMGFESLDERNEARICMVLNVPPIVVGAAVGLKRSTYSNYEEARKAWWQDSLLGLYEHFDDSLNAGLGPDFPGVKMVWDFSNVPALQEDLNALWERYRSSTNAGLITLNEFREGVGLPRIKGGDILVRNLAQLEVPVVIEGGTKALTAPMASKLLNDSGSQKDEAMFSSKMEKFLKMQLQRVLLEVDDQKAIVAVEEGKSIWDDFFWEGEVNWLLKFMLPLIVDIATRVGKQSYAYLESSVGIGISWELVNEQVAQWARDYSAAQVKNITGTTKKMVQDKVMDWINNPAPLKDLEVALRPEFGAVRALRIAVTEVTNAYAKGNLETWKATNVVQKKRWRTAITDVCPICVSLEGQEVGINDMFVDGYGGQHECPAAHVNCRCWIQPVVNPSI